LFVASKASYNDRVSTCNLRPLSKISDAEQASKAGGFLDVGNCDLGVLPVLLSGDTPAWKAAVILRSVWIS
jgi:hypothetical protein